MEENEKKIENRFISWQNIFKKKEKTGIKENIHNGKIIFKKI